MNLTKQLIKDIEPAFEVVLGYEIITMDDTKSHWIDFWFNNIQFSFINGELSSSIAYKSDEGGIHIYELPYDYLMEKLSEKLEKAFLKRCAEVNLEYLMEETGFNDY